MATLRNTAFRESAAQAIGTLFPQNSTIVIYTGTEPGVNSAPTGTVLVTFTLGPTPWASGGADGQITLAGVPLSATASAAGTAGYFRIRNVGVTDWMQGTVTATGGGGDMTIDNVVIANGQTVNLTGFTLAVPE